MKARLPLPRLGSVVGDGVLGLVICCAPVVRASLRQPPSYQKYDIPGDKGDGGELNANESDLLVRDCIRR